MSRDQFCYLFTFEFTETSADEMFELLNHQENRCSLILWSIEYRQFFKANVLEFLRNSLNSHVIVWSELHIDIDQDRHAFSFHLLDPLQARTQIRLFSVVEKQG